MAALTLKPGPERLELYAALKNTGDTPVCSPAFSVELLDHEAQPLASGLTGLLVPSFYALTDDSGNIAACVAPGETAMGAIRDLPAELAHEHVGALVYFCNFWTLEGAPLVGLEIDDVRPIVGDGGAAFAGSLRNGFDVALSAPAVAVFALSASGRPLDLALAEGSDDVAPGETWEFETQVVSEPGAAQAAFPLHGP